MAHETPDRPFTITLRRSGRSFLIPANESAADVLIENGVDLEVSCQQGVCGTCATRVLSGIPEHHDVYFTAAEQAANDRFTPCCSRAKTDVLVIDL